MTWHPKVKRNNARFNRVSEVPVEHLEGRLSWLRFQLELLTEWPRTAKSLGKEARMIERELERRAA